MSPGWNLEDYEPVEDRLRAFWSDYPTGRIETELLHVGTDGYIVKASVYRHRFERERDAENTLADSTGLAQEAVTERGVNATSALENCETSAIGRALANLGYAAKGKRPSREEMSKASGDSAKGKGGAPEDRPAGPSSAGGSGRRVDTASSAPSTSGVGDEVSSSRRRTGPAPDPSSEDGKASDTSAATTVSNAGVRPADDAAPGEASQGTSPSATSPGSGYPVDPSKCDHRTASGAGVKWKVEGAGSGDPRYVCPKCGLDKIAAMEGTTADLGTAS